MNALAEACIADRAVMLRTRGQRHGSITRLVSPSDVGELIKPFVFLDFFDVAAANAPAFGWHPHSGIATVSVLHDGALAYQETTGVQGILGAGGVEWMRAGRGVWHTGSVADTGRTRGFQLWIALREDLESAPCHSRYLAAEDVPCGAPARVILGSYGGLRSPIPSPDGIIYLDVRLAAGERWTYQPPPGHEVAWLAVSEGVLRAPERAVAGELLVFEESNEALTVEAGSASQFVLGSAVKHPHELVCGSYSVHTSEAALAAGESEIRRIGAQLSAAGLLQRRTGVGA